MAKAKPTAVQVKSNIPDNKVLASPTRKFFVEMLTRDIELDDAIMDLIDNCIDGVHRMQKTKQATHKINYKGFFAHINIDENHFSINDNCGGIPKDVAKNYAFKMGRETEYKEEEELETIGVYGIGMKRAIFKMGLEADVISYHDNDIFKVSIPKNWVNQKDEWFFEFESLNKSNLPSHLKKQGTSISISHLHQNISSKFSDKAGFLQDLVHKLRYHYGYIIDLGFEIKLNNTPIGSIQLNLLTSPTAKKAQSTIAPFVYQSKIGSVTVLVMIGFYRPPAEQEEINKELDGSYAKSRSDNAGVTVLCNDRVVAYANKDYLTGWGDSPVPSYHTQFINIAGVVHFRSSSPIDLPITTTKRGLDTSSPVYIKTKQKIKEGLKIFTDFTNQWKSPSEARTKLFRSMQTINALDPDQEKNRLLNLQKRKGETGLYQIPVLPKPVSVQRENQVVIHFTKEKKKITDMLEYYFNGEDKSPSELGSFCFDKMHSRIK